MSEETVDHLAIVKQFLDPRSKYIGDPYAIAARSALLHYAFDIAGHDPALSVMLNKLVAEEVERERTLRNTPVEPSKVVHKESIAEPTKIVGGNFTFDNKDYGVIEAQSVGVLQCPRCHVLLSSELETCPECGLDMYLV